MADEHGLDCRPAEGGVIFPLRVRPGGRADRIAGVHDRALRVDVTAAPEKGKANKAVIALLTKALGMPKREVRIVSGETNSRKKVLVNGLDCVTLYRKFAPLCGLDAKPGTKNGRKGPS